MGTTKQVLEVGGVPLVALAVDKAGAAGADPVIVVLGAQSAEVRACLGHRNCVAVENVEWKEGMASSVRRGVAEILARHPALDAVLVAPCDQPGLTSEALRRLFHHCEVTGRTSCARYKGRNGAPAVFVRADLPMLMSLTGDEGARAILNSGSGSVVPVELPELGTDLDTQADVEAWRARQA
jgi:CTP:molybdopterin cytidylyltransferase MocA